jgi:hypothetical protein
MKTPTTEEILDAYSEKLAADIEAMTDEQVAEKLAEMEDGEHLAKLAEEQEALGRFMHVGYKAAMLDFADLLEKHAGDKTAAIAEFEADMAENASEIEASEEEAAKLASAEEGTDEDASAADVALAAAIEADPEAIMKVAAQVLDANDIAVYALDADGNPVEELALS